jgi:hypothetical protein
VHDRFSRRTPLLTCRDDYLGGLFPEVCFVWHPWQLCARCLMPGRCVAARRLECERLLASGRSRGERMSKQLCVARQQLQSLHLRLHQQDLIERIPLRGRLVQRRRGMRGRQWQKVDALAAQDLHYLRWVKWSFRSPEPCSASHFRRISQSELH